jgi:flagellar biosynthesis protein FlhB
MRYTFRQKYAKGGIMFFPEVQRSHVVISAGRFLAAALEYKRGCDYCPVVSAKAKNLGAVMIKLAARSGGVLVRENSVLARNLYRLKNGDSVPPEHYDALTSIFADAVRIQKKPGKSFSAKMQKVF